MDCNDNTKKNKRKKPSASTTHFNPTRKPRKKIVKENQHNGQILEGYTANTSSSQSRQPLADITNGPRTPNVFNSTPKSNSNNSTYSFLPCQLNSNGFSTPVNMNSSCIFQPNAVPSAGSHLNILPQVHVSPSLDQNVGNIYNLGSCQTHTPPVYDTHNKSNYASGYVPHFILPYHPYSFCGKSPLSHAPNNILQTPALYNKTNAIVRHTTSIQTPSPYYSTSSNKLNFGEHNLKKKQVIPSEVPVIDLSPGEFQTNFVGRMMTNKQSSGQQKLQLEQVTPVSITSTRLTSGKHKLKGVHFNSDDFPVTHFTFEGHELNDENRPPNTGISTGAHGNNKSSLTHSVTTTIKNPRFVPSTSKNPCNVPSTSKNLCSVPSMANNMCSVLSTSKASRSVQNTSKNMPSTTPKIKTKHCHSNVTVTNLAFQTHEADDENRQPLFTGISRDYIDIGDQTMICQQCHAKLWKSEARRGSKKGCKNTYSLCCGYGKVELPKLRKAPRELLNLYRNQDSRSKNFIQNIRRYNMMFSFTSMGGKVDPSVNRGGAPYVFRLHGQNYHTIGSLLPPDGSTPKFSQLYIVDTENEVSNRANAVSSRNDRSTKSQDSIDHQTIDELKRMLDRNNVLVMSYRMVRDSYHSNGQENRDIKLRLVGRRAQDGRTYNLPTASEVAAVIFGDIGDSLDKRDIIVESKTGRLQRINELHPSYLALQYPLLFPYGEDGYRVDIPHRGVVDIMKSKRPNCTMREWFAYRIQDRRKEFSIILNSRRLLQQFLVDAYTMVETERLYFIRSQQKVLRCDTYQNLSMAYEQGINDASSTGKRVYLPSSFTGGARYMQQNYLDAMSIVKWFGYPDLFLTLTCNPKWPEITRFLENTGLRPEDRPDILVRLFKIKIDLLIKNIKKKEIFGRVQAVVYTIEFQKRGLPHSHICLFLHTSNKLPTAQHLDPFISAEIPNKEEDPELYRLVSDYMMHGPCGEDNPSCPCMVDGKCSKKFPKPFSNQTSVDSDGFPVYRRRDNGNIVKKGRAFLDNRYVVPYNSVLLKQFQAHLNVEWCNQAGSIKYLFKYINKGPDRITAAVVSSTDDNHEEHVIDEIKEYYDCRYVSACEAAWRLFGYDVHYRTPSVTRLPFHLPGQHQVVYDADEQIEDVLDKPSLSSLKFLSWMECNQMYEEARVLSYVEFPTKFVWKAKKRKWVPRKKGFSVGRINHCPSSVGEAYYLRILLNIVKGPTSFEEIRTVDGSLYITFRDACFALGLLDDDNEYIIAIEEASHWGMGHYIRYLFVMLLTSSSVSRPEFLWEKTWQFMSDDIRHNRRSFHNSPASDIDNEEIKKFTLFEIEKIMIRLGTSLKNFDSMPYPDHDYVVSSTNRLIFDELSYNNNMLRSEHEQLFSNLSSEQRHVFDTIMNAVQNNTGGVFFVYGYGGTGKTYIWKTLSAAIRSKSEIVLNVASSGIASLLLSGGRTAHSRFRIPINLNEDSVCNIKPNTDIAALLVKTKLIIWDEAPMVHKHAFEALDRTLKDILSTSTRNVSDKPFGGKVIVFGGDFRQILPVIQKGNRHDIVNASLKYSYLWNDCQVLKLTVNMRLNIGCDTCDLEETKRFAEWILKIGEGTVSGPNDGETDVKIPDELLIKDSSDPIGSIIEFVYPDVLANLRNPSYFQERAILAPTHEVVDIINDRLLELFTGEEKVYLSSDRICESEHVRSDFDNALYSPDVLNGLKLSGLPNHKLILKVGVPIMLLRNIDQAGGLCNGTRLQVVKLGERVIEAEIISGNNIGHRTFIPRMRLSPSDRKIPFKIQRRQFPVAVCFAMTINKSQGQSLSRVGLFLPRPVFTHGQLYVALSRVKSRKGLKVLIMDKDGKLSNTTTNVVYKEVLTNL